jgi:hypothetical protein
MRISTLRFAVSATALGTVVAVAAPAPSASAAIRPFHAWVVPQPDYSAVGSVEGGLSSAYLITLTNIGVQQAPTATSGVVADTDHAIGNPAVASVGGGFVPSNGHVTFVLTWTAIGGGSSGSLPVECSTVLGTFSCGPADVQLLAG